MDSLLSNAQRCARKADSLVKLGLYDEAMSQLDKSIVYLNELKSNTARYENIQMLNVQIDSIDRKKRSVAIKRSESNKKKSRIENLISKNRNESRSRAYHNHHDHSPVIVDFDELISTKPNFHKLDKDQNCIIEELSTTNAEYKKVNSFLINEIEELKKENDFLKVELIKLHMSESLSCGGGGGGGGGGDGGEDEEINDEAENTCSLSSSTPKSSPSINKNNILKSKILNCSNNESTHESKLRSSRKQQQPGSSTSSSLSHSSSSWSISSSSQNSTDQKQPSPVRPKYSTDKQAQPHPPKAHICSAIDLSKYLDDNDEDDELLVGKPSNRKHCAVSDRGNEGGAADTEDECDEFNGHNLPPQEFTID